jgi:subtilisin family serine protease
MKKHYKKLLLVSILVILLLASTLPALGAPEKVRVFVEFAPGAKVQVQKALSREGAQFHYTFDNLQSFVVSVPAQALKGLEKNPNVVNIEVDAPRYPVKSILTEAAFETDAIWNDIGDIATEQVLPWGVQAVQADDVWDDGAIIGEGVKVCIIDTGYYPGHADLPDFEDIELDGWSQVDEFWTEDGYGHGTHVAGTIAAKDNFEGVIGVSPGVDFYIVKIFDNAGEWVSQAHASDLAAAAYDCADNGANIISMSLSGTNSNAYEERAFDQIYAAGVLSVGAASNDGIEEYHYPATYESVISVAALDSDEEYADFSQFNDAVELAAPGVGVLSTVPYLDESSLTVDGVGYQVNHIEFSGRGAVDGALVDGGLCMESGSWNDMIVLCERGEISFAEKILNAEAGGGAGVLIYNNLPGNMYMTMGEDSSPLIGLSLSQEDGQYLVANELGTTAYLSSTYTWPASSYEGWGGTSMATPHVSAVAALLWSAYPDATNVEIREAMDATAKDLGEEGRDVHYGYGMVQAADALEYLGEPPSTTLNIEVSTDQDEYYDKDNVYITVDVSPGSAHQDNASVTVVVTTPNGKVTTFTGVTNPEGVITFKFKTMVKKYDAGTFDVVATATLTGFDSNSASTSFILIE